MSAYQSYYEDYPDVDKGHADYREEGGRNEFEYPTSTAAEVTA